MGGGYELGLSASTSLSTAVGAGDFIVTGGGSKVTQTLLIVAGIAVLFWLFFRRNK